MSKLVNSIFQAGIIVDDLEKTVRFYAEELGVGPWKIFRWRGPDGEPLAVFARGFAGGAMNKGFEIELFDKRYLDIMPLHAEFYAEHGQGIDHLCFGCEDFLATREALMKKFPILLDTSAQGYNPDTVNCVYFDARKELGMIVEIAEYPVGAEEGKCSTYQWEEEVYPAKVTV